MPSNAFSTTPAASATSGGDYFQSIMNWQLAVGKSMLLAQREQWEMLVGWQRAIGAAQREVMDQWICRFGGGVPIDG
ncbi:MULTISPECIES: hypothetical protein [unclassified Variovorax]|uniref:hypothetical protein n=1 Tax=unclassified Variovorax TaxID=663243 RepID=UPI000D126D56|nr:MULTISPECIES: hypothetical protein [unclassified Variovorax]AVQ85622.1 hypothetical protein C4F17_31990 [Variovorax sp. PMC12]QRY35250.1 hypothetical protein JVX96_28335 [Variovorax sp. PDNC026]